MSVTYANALAQRIDASFLCCTRKEGLLKKQLAPEVGYLFLNKKNTFDLQAFRKLRRFVKENRIDLIQAHSSSWFLGLMVKSTLLRVKLVWHDHYGRDLNQRRAGSLKPASNYFDGILSVNTDLQKWSLENLYCKKVHYFRNFLYQVSSSGEITSLKGGGTFQIICVANLRPQKDHLNLLNAFRILLERNPEVSLHLVGEDQHDCYSKGIKNHIIENDLQKKVFLYGEKEKVGLLIQQADLGILSSESEGLPMALLEYGFFGIPAVCTDVGKCAEVLGKEGKIVPAKDPEALAAAMAHYIENETRRKIDGDRFRHRVMNKFSEETVLPKVITFLQEL